MNKNEPVDWKKYVIVFFITGTLFVSVLWLSSFLNTKKIDELRSVQDKIYVDLMASEVQFSLLQESSCKDVSTTVLSSELNSLADKISYSENNIGNTDSDVISLKKYYSILEIKDYLLMKKITEQCGNRPIFILYFYKNDNCPDCTKQGFVLTSMREQYPNLRVYSFDETLNLPVIKTLTSLYKVKESALPALVINGRAYPGFQDINAIEKILPELKKIEKKSATTVPAAATEKSATDSPASATPAQ
ncbi:MAG: hypothetical protein WCK91_00360 [bacterium]